MTSEQKSAIQLLMTRPQAVGVKVGFTKLTELHNKWMLKMLHSKQDETLQAHRGSYKTTCLSIVIAIIMIVCPSERIAFIRKTNDDVKEIIKQIKKILLHPIMQELCRRIWGVYLYFTTENATELNTNLSSDTKGTSQLTGFGIGASITGKHYDRIFTDDIVNVEDRTSKAERDKTKIIYQELQNVKNRGGHIFNTGTPWHKDDCFAIMPKAEKYDCYSTGLMSEEQIEEIKGNMLRSLFCANYELRHVATEDVIFDNPVLNGDPTMIQQAKYSHIDASYGGDDGTAFTIAKRVGSKLYVYGRLYQKHVDDCLDDIISVKNGFMGNKIWCEDNGDKGYLAKEIKKKNERAVTYHESMNKYIKITSYLKGEWNNIIFVTGTDDDYIQQILDYNENAEHDDAPDSLASVCRLMYSKADETQRRIPQIYNGGRM